MDNVKSPLGTYYIEPLLTGKCFLHHTHAAISREYDSIIAIEKAIMSLDYNTLRVAVADYLAAVTRIVLYNASRHAGQLNHMRADWVRRFHAVHVAISPETAILCQALRDAAPLVVKACSDDKLSKEVTTAAAIVADYYDRYLTSYAGFDDVYLSK